jgi:hypothetical protein
MKNKNRIIALMLISAMVLSLVGCSKNSDSDDTTSTTEPEFTEIIPASSNSEGSDPTTAPTTESTAESTTETTATTTTDSTEATTTTTSKATDPILSEKDIVGGLTDEQLNSINMLNYMTSLTRKINEEKGNQLYLETAYESFDNLYPNSVDRNTQAQVTSLMDTIQNYRMISVKRERLQYIYEQNTAQAYRKAVPNPMGLLSAVASGSKIKMIAAVVYMAIDSATSYASAKSQADLDFIKDGWELDDEEANELHNSTKSAMNYMFDMVRNYELPGDLALNKEAVENFVIWSNKPDSQLERKISWFESNQNTYAAFGPYWLELAKDYYNNGNYKKCLEAVHRYEAVSSRIFRKDKDYANVLPMAIVSARETMTREEYVKLASNYCEVIHENTKDKDWTYRYFVAQIYMDLYSMTKDKSYIDKAYTVARENVNYLVDEQKRLNAEYLSDVKEVKAGKDATKREKKEIKQYNKAIKAERKTALPPVSEALYLNAELLFGLAKEKNINATEKKKIENILHENGDAIFLAKALDDRFWFNKTSSSVNIDDISMEFDGTKIVIPASCIADRSKISVTVTGANGTKTFENWVVTEVKRPKKSQNCSEFRVTLKLKDSEKYKYQVGDAITVRITPVEEVPNVYWDFNYRVVETRTAGVIKGTAFERVK